MKRVVEIKAAEGGKDAQLFVTDLEAAFLKMAQRKG